MHTGMYVSFLLQHINSNIIHPILLVALGAAYFINMETAYDKDHLSNILGLCVFLLLCVNFLIMSRKNRLQICQDQTLSFKEVFSKLDGYFILFDRNLNVLLVTEKCNCFLNEILETNLQFSFIETSITETFNKTQQSKQTTLRDIILFYQKSTYEQIQIKVKNLQLDNPSSKLISIDTSKFINNIVIIVNIVLYDLEKDILNIKTSDALIESQAQSRYDQEGKFLQSISHELRTPLNIQPVSYTHLTLPTICSVQISVVAVSLKKKKNMTILIQQHLQDS
eukprot:TRINITY_DN8154_c0_g1_i3.p1 TRINITY_DN8154_c0_g1~~TRINITY_DN8154_c0_g1_i3.p1  ORF type:complete len:281 (+),score=19.87 TRINITY_DN8154_c0_g1_i3:364-1206(+)